MTGCILYVTSQLVIRFQDGHLSVITYDLLELQGDICGLSACSSYYCFAVLGIFQGGLLRIPVDHS